MENHCWTPKIIEEIEGFTKSLSKRTIDNIENKVHLECVLVSSPSSSSRFFSEKDHMCWANVKTVRIRTISVSKVS